MSISPDFYTSVKYRLKGVALLLFIVVVTALGVVGAAVIFMLIFRVLLAHERILCR
jgi:cell division septal protein FtsQ